MESPKPAPFPLCLVVKNGSKMRCWWDFDIVDTGMVLQQFQGLIHNRIDVHLVQMRLRTSGKTKHVMDNFSNPLYMLLYFFYRFSDFTQVFTFLKSLVRQQITHPARF